MNIPVELNLIKKLSVKQISDWEAACSSRAPPPVAGHVVEGDEIWNWDVDGTSERKLEFYWAVVPPTS